MTSELREYTELQNIASSAILVQFVERTVQRVELSVTQKAGNRYCEWMDTDIRHWTDDAWRRCVGDPHKNRKIRTHVLNDLRTYPNGMKLSQFIGENRYIKI